MELIAVNTANARLTSALQESTANVDEWNRQLQLYKEENARLRAKYADLEASKISEGNSEALRLRAEALENELRSRNDEIKSLTMATKNKDYMVSIKRINNSHSFIISFNFLKYFIVPIFPIYR